MEYVGFGIIKNKPETGYVCKSGKINVWGTK
jgi:hypothetical protein